MPIPYQRNPSPTSNPKSRIGSTQERDRAKGWRWCPILWAALLMLLSCKSVGHNIIFFLVKHSTTQTIHMHACILTIMHTSPNKIPSRLSVNASALTFETDLQMEWVGFTIRSTPLCNNIVYVAAMCTSASCGYMSETNENYTSPYTSRH